MMVVGACRRKGVQKRGKKNHFVSRATRMKETQKQVASMLLNLKKK